jgi:hypothetical protein
LKAIIVPIEHYCLFLVLVYQPAGYIDLIGKIKKYNKEEMTD